MKAVIDQDDVFIVDKTTGEIVRTYTVTKSSRDYKEERRLKAQVMDITFAKSKAQLDDWIGSNVDKRKIIRKSYLESYSEQALAELAREGKTSFTLKDYEVVKKLIPLIQYRNIACVQTTKLATLFNQKGSNRASKVVYKLKKYSSLFKVHTRGVVVKECRIELNPILAWVYESNGFNLSRENAIKDWLTPNNSDSYLKAPPIRNNLKAPPLTEEQREWYVAFGKSLANKQEQLKEQHSITEYKDEWMY